jgi:transaldolase
MKKPTPIKKLKIKIYADGAEKASMLALAQEPFVKGLTTNPTLMRKAGVSDYVGFAKEILAAITKKPISFEVFSDDFADMERQAREIASWGKNVYVKIPITNTQGKSAIPLVKKLSEDGIKLNVTAILTMEQIKQTIGALSAKTPAIVSVFAGRIADTGIDPRPVMKEAKRLMKKKKNIELLWASSRELYNIYDAEAVGTDIITVTPDILKKLRLVGYDNKKLSLETVQMFYEDGVKAGYTL